MPKKKELNPLGDIARPYPMPEQGSRGRRPSLADWPSTEAETERTRNMREVTFALSHNLLQVHWAWENPVKAYEPVSVPMQQITTFLALTSLFPLEEMMNALADDWQAMRKIPEWVAPDLMPDQPEGFLANLSIWRQAVAHSQVEVLLDQKGRHVTGLRAWLPETAECPAWEMVLDNERLSGIVESLMKALPFWGAAPLGFMPPSKVRPV